MTRMENEAIDLRNLKVHATRRTKEISDVIVLFLTASRSTLVKVLHSPRLHYSLRGVVSSMVQSTNTKNKSSKLLARSEYFKP